MVSAIVLIFPLYSLFGHSFQQIGKEKLVQDFLNDSWDQYGITQAESGIVMPEAPPDVYYIILDGYSRSDILEVVYEYDNSTFEESLRERGFFIAKESRSNYSHTAESLSSSLNMMPINSLPEYLNRGFVFNDKWLFHQAILDVLHSNRIMNILRQHGYQTVSFDTGSGEFNFYNSDYYLVSPRTHKSGYSSKKMFEIFFLETFIGDLSRKDDTTESDLISSLYDAKRETITYTFDNIHRFANMDGQHFIFAHVIAPHPPYVFGPNGKEVGNFGVFTLDDVTKNNRDYRLYIDQLQYINTLVIDAIDQILSESDTTPIIIIQGDHGARIYLDDNRSKEITDKIRFPILNAYLLPGIDAESVLYPSISPINSFRVVLNKYFGTNFDLLEDRSYEWTPQADRKFIPVCADNECD